MKCMFVFSVKMNSQTDWLNLSVGGHYDLRQSLFFIVSYNLNAWQQIVFLWTTELPPVHCSRMLAISILMPSLCSPWSCSPWWPDTKEKPGKSFAPGPGYQLSKEQLRTTTSTGRNKPTMASTKLRDNTFKKMLFRLNKHTKQVNDMSNRWVTKHSRSN